uniref:Uncharacterized protein n=2 Tax=Equus TaxID=9789 RepID=A0A9L0RKB7_HORSE
MMESVGVYGFCGCTAKNKMKCDSRWEVTATGPARTSDLCRRTGPGTQFNAVLSPS